jgi:hypothetical protein
MVLPLCPDFQRASDLHTLCMNGSLLDCVHCLVVFSLCVVWGGRGGRFHVMKMYARTFS